MDRQHIKGTADMAKCVLLLAVIGACGALAACSFHSETVEKRTPAPTAVVATPAASPTVVYTPE